MFSGMLCEIVTFIIGQVRSAKTTAHLNCLPKFVVGDVMFFPASLALVELSFALLCLCTPLRLHHVGRCTSLFAPHSKS